MPESRLTGDNGLADFMTRFADQRPSFFMRATRVVHLRPMWAAAPLPRYSTVGDFKNADGRPYREGSFRRRCSLSFMISLISAAGRISIVPHFNLTPGYWEVS
jgi:hypothetical protein